MIFLFCFLDLVPKPRYDIKQFFRAIQQS
ncbi:MAG TPA: palindromic element RPE4 domain-containing protein [Rickettsia endosymbiont of Bembidion nr. Transversale]|nr:palindromic element RPE4 domain-containing protein [Rickettsia endosymbiont of Bembidion nr. Transversale]